MKVSRNIMIVEDDVELSRLYQIRLEKGGYKVSTAHDGDEAILKIISEKPDFILLDLMLPKQGGIGVLRVLKSHPDVKDIPIMVLTAYDHFNYRKDTYAYVVDFLLKTEVTPFKIVEKIGEYFEKH